MKTITTLAALGVLAAGSALQAQQPRFGFALNLGFPTGEFRSRDIPATSTTGKQNEGFDAGFGGQFTISFPVQQAVALRMNFSAQGTSGSRTESGQGSRDLQHDLFSLGAEMQLFFNGSASRHKGTYLYFGPCADFERWDYTNDHYWDNSYNTYDRKSRMGATAGLGHSFGYQTGRFTMEMGFHKTLSGNDINRGDPPSSDFVKLSFGWVF